MPSAEAIFNMAGDVLIVGDNQAGFPLGPLIIWMLVRAFIALPHFLNFDDSDSSIPIE